MKIINSTNDLLLATYRAKIIRIVRRMYNEGADYESILLYVVDDMRFCGVTNINAVMKQTRQAFNHLNK